MAGRETPTNEHVVTLLKEVLRKLKALGDRQKRIEAKLAKLAKTTH